MPSVSLQATSSGNTQLVAAPTSGFIRVHAFEITALTAVDEVQFRSGSSTIVSRTNSTAAVAGGVSKHYHKDGYFDCAPTTALVVNLSGSGTVDINVTYSIVTG